MFASTHSRQPAHQPGWRSLKVQLGLFASMLLLSACAVGPDYKTPVAAPVVLQNAPAGAFSTANPEAEWWKAFNDPVLDGLIAQA
jgi:multidrug efflux system outer membrane protein